MSPSEPKRSWRMAQRVADDLRGMILQGELSHATRLPPAPEFAVRLGISRHHLSGALRLLEHDGLVRVSPGRGGGIFITHPEEGGLKRSFGLNLARNGTLLADLMVARAVLEPLIAAMAAASATDGDLDALEQNIGDQEMLGEYHKGLNARFHLGVAAAAHNQTLLVTMQAMEELVHSIDLEVGRTELIEGSLRAHRAILRALRARDAEKAASLMRRHVLGYQEQIAASGIDLETYSVADLIESASRRVFPDEVQL